MKHILKTLTLALGILASPAWAVTVSDGDFTSWSSFSFVTDDPYVAAPGPGTSTGSATSVATGGNPGALLRVTHTFTTGDTVWTGGIKTDYSYDPSTQGALASISLDADLRHPSSGSSAWQLVVEQSGQRYYSVPWSAFSANSNWAHFSTAGLAATSFDTNPWAGYAGVQLDGNQPNFGANGAPLRFGFMFGNRVIGTGTLTNVLELDNFTVITTPVPEPVAAALMLAGLILVGWQVRKHRKHPGVT